MIFWFLQLPRAASISTPEFIMSNKPLTVAWISDFPVEWLPDLPDPWRALARQPPATWQLVLLSEFQKNPNLRIHVILMRRRIQRSIVFERNGVTFHVLKVPASLRLLSLFWADTLEIRRVCREIKPDLIHAWGSEKGAALIAKRLRYPYVATVQGLLTWYKQVVPLVAYEKFAELLERKSFPYAPVVTTESTFAVEFLRKSYPGLVVHQAEHASNWSFHQVQRRPVTSPVRFICIASLGYRKGTDILLRALDTLRPEVPFKLTLICGPNLGYLETLRPQLSPELWNQIEFKHHLLPHEIARELETATMMLMPTRADVSPNAVKESLVAGLPVIATRIGGIPDYLIDGKNGFLVAVNDLEGFTKAIRAACAHPLFGQGRVDPDTLVKTRAYLSPERMAKNFLAAYELALGRPATGQ
jgi:glycosyltransferase involved in cell wall biosynthesis